MDPPLHGREQQCHQNDKDGYNNQSFNQRKCTLSRPNKSVRLHELVSRIGGVPLRIFLVPRIIRWRKGRSLGLSVVVPAATVSTGLLCVVFPLKVTVCWVWILQMLMVWARVPVVFICNFELLAPAVIALLPCFLVFVFR